jgi:hypothetical protein
LRRLSEKGFVAKANDDDQSRIEEDVYARGPGESASGVEGEGGDEDEDGRAKAEVEGCPLEPLDHEERYSEEGDAGDRDAFWEREAHMLG